MQIFTSYFAKAAKLPTNIVPVSISIWPPKGWTGKELKALAPTEELLRNYKRNHNWAEYVEKYQRDVLSKIVPGALIQQLYTLSSGRDVALICFEKNPAKCHRSLVANWLQQIGYHVEEFKF